MGGLSRTGSSRVLHLDHIHVTVFELFFLDVVVDSSTAVGVKCCLSICLPCLWIGKTDWRLQIIMTWSYNCCEKGAGVTRDPVHPSLTPALGPRRRWLREASPGVAAL